MLRSLVPVRGAKYFKSTPSIFGSLANIGDRHYHRSAVNEFGRKDGNSGFKTKPRDFSKNQKRRWRKKMAIQETKEKHDSSANMKSDFMIDQISTPEASEFLDETNNRFESILYQLKKVTANL